RPHADTVMAGEEVEPRASGLEWFQSLKPLVEDCTGSREERVQYEWRQRKLIHHVRLVAVAEVGDVVRVGHVCLRQQPGAGGDSVDDRSPELHNGVSLRQMNARGPASFPEVSDGVESYGGRAMCEVAQENFGELHEHARIADI